MTTAPTRPRGAGWARSTASRWPTPAKVTGLAAYDRARRKRTQMVTLRSHRLGVVAQWESPLAVRLRNTALRLTPDSSLIRPLAPLLDRAP